MYQSSTTFPLRTIESPVLQLEPASTSRRAPLFFLAAAALLSVFAFMAPLEYAWTRPSYDESDDAQRSEIANRDGSMQRQLTLGGLGLLGVAGFGMAWSEGRRLRLNGALGVVCIAYVAWCAATCLWSDDLGISVRREIALGCEILAGMGIALHASPRQFAWFVFTCTLMWFGLGLTAELSQGTLQPWIPGYRFKGIFHANIMSISCVLLIMSSLYLRDGTKAKQAALLVIAAAAFFFLVLTGSRTALASLFASYLMVAMITVRGPKRLVLSGAILATVACAFIAYGLGVFDVSEGLVSLGRQDNEVSSFTGRVPLWTELLTNYAPDRFIEGYGYGAFWSNERIYRVSVSQRWDIPYAHSTYIDLLLAIGFVGAILFAAGMLIAFMRAARLEVRHAKAGYGFIALVIASVLTDGLMESTFGSTWFMSFFGICAVCFLLTNDPAVEQLQRGTPSN